MSKITMVDVTTKGAKPWNIIKEQNHAYIVRDDIFQRIRLSDNIAIDPDKANRDIPKSAFKGITVLELGTNIILINNPKNLNPCLVKPKNSTSDMDMLLLTIGGQFKIRSYKLNTKTSIRCTFKNTDTIGALISFDSKFEGEIITLELYRRDNIYDVKYVYRNGEIRYSMVRRKDKALHDSLKPISFRFYMDMPITEVYITSKRHSDYMIEYLNKNSVKGWSLISLDDPNDLDIIRKNLHELQRMGYRAITLYGVEIPFDMLKEFKFQYVFVKSRTKGLYAIKSN